MSIETQQDFLREALARLKMSRTELANRLGISQKTLNNWMAPENTSDYRTLPKIARNYLIDLIFWDRVTGCEILNGGILSVASKFEEEKLMTLRERFLDAVIEGRIGHGLIVTRKEFMDYFADENPAYTGVFLSNSEIKTGTHSPTWEHFTSRVKPGVYRVHPAALLQRTRPERNIELSVVREANGTLSLFSHQKELGPAAKHRCSGRLAENKNQADFYKAIVEAVQEYSKDGDTRIFFTDAS